MKCHTCQKKLEAIDRDDKYHTNQIVLECPNMHLTVKLNNKNVIAYTMVWDEDEEAKDRYKLISRQGITGLYHSHGFVSTNSRSRQYKTVMTIPQMLPLIIKNDIVQCDNLIIRLQKLKIFA